MPKRRTIPKRLRAHLTDPEIVELLAGHPRSLFPTPGRVPRRLATAACRNDDLGPARLLAMGIAAGRLALPRDARR